MKKEVGQGLFKVASMIWMYKHLYILYTWTHTYVCIYIYMYVRMCIMRKGAYISKIIYIHIHICIYSRNSRLRRRFPRPPGERRLRRPFEKPPPLTTFLLKRQKKLGCLGRSKFVSPRLRRIRCLK